MSARFSQPALSAAMAVLALTVAGCKSSSGVMAPTPTDSGSPPSLGRIASDSALFALVTQTQPFSTYRPFPNLSAGADGILVASSAHQPLIRVSLNATAADALQNGKLPAGSTFPDGSVIFKEVLTGSRTLDVYAIMYKDRTNTLAGNGWLWAEYRASGSVVFSIANRGSACTSCHALEQGPRNDFVRIFERQR